MRWLTTLQQWPRCWLVLSLASAVAGCTHPMAADAPVVDRVLGDHVLREQLVARGTLDAHFVHEVLHQLGQGPREITNSLDSSPTISTTTQPPLARSMGNSLGTKAFKSGSLSKCEEQRVALEAHDQSVSADSFGHLCQTAAPMRAPERQTELLAFRLGDYAAGILTGVHTALAVRLIVGSPWAIVMAMLVGMAVGHQMTGETEATGQDRFT